MVGSGEQEEETSPVVYPDRVGRHPHGSAPFGRVDFVLDPAVQDVARLSKDSNVKILSGSEDR